MFASIELFVPIVWLIRRGREDTKGLLNSVHQSVFLRHLTYLVETGIWLGKNYPENRRPKKDVVFQATCIFDMVYFKLLYTV